MAQEYLETVRDLKVKIEQEERNAAVYELMANKVVSGDSSKLGVAVSGRSEDSLGGRVQEFGTRAADILQKALSIRMEWLDAREIAEREVTRISCAINQTILIERYFHNRPWHKIIKMVGYEERQVFNRHKDALLELSFILQPV